MTGVAVTVTVRNVLIPESQQSRSASQPGRQSSATRHGRHSIGVFVLEFQYFQTVTVRQTANGRLTIALP